MSLNITRPYAARKLTGTNFLGLIASFKFRTLNLPHRWALAIQGSQADGYSVTCLSGDRCAATT